MQGFNRYFPPDFDHKDKKRDTINKIAGSHALGDRVRKLDKGILIVRFELPFNIWCGHCDAHIGMGVRYNAEKKRIGSYYSTPIYSFRCKCHLCAGWFEMQTDPKNTRYVVTEGAKQQAQDWDPEEEGGHPVSYTKEGEDPTAGNAFAKFEKTSVTKARALTAAERLDELEQHNEDRWSDPYELNRNLRKALREDKGKRREKRGRDDELLNRYGLGEGVRMDLVRADESKRDGDDRADWLSSATSKETIIDAEEEEVWQAAQAKRRRLLAETEEKKRLLHAETGWADTGQSSNAIPGPSRNLSSINRSSRSVAVSRAPVKSNLPASRLAGQLRMNSARKTDPFASASMPSLSLSSLLGSSVRPKKK